MAAQPTLYFCIASNQNVSRTLIMHSVCLGQEFKFFSYFFQSSSKFQRIKKPRRYSENLSQPDNVLKKFRSKRIKIIFFRPPKLKKKDIFFSSKMIVNPIPAGVGVNLTPLQFFLHNSKTVKIFRLFLHTQSPPFRSKTGL